MADYFKIELVFESIPKLLKFLPVTLELTLIALVIGLLLGLLIAVIRLYKVPVLSQLFGLFVSVIRGTPIIVQLYLIYYGIPIMLRYINFYTGTNLNINGIPGIAFAIIALGIRQSAFNSETIRSALQSVDRGQIEAAQALGMSNIQVLVRIIIPEAAAVALIPLGNSAIGLIQGTSLAFACSVVELTAQSKILGAKNYRYFEVYCALAIIYWLITIILEWILKFIEKRINVPEQVPALDNNGRLLRRKQNELS